MYYFESVREITEICKAHGRQIQETVSMGRHSPSPESIDTVALHLVDSLVHMAQQLVVQLAGRFVCIDLLPVAVVF